MASAVQYRTLTQESVVHNENTGLGLGNKCAWVGSGPILTQTTGQKRLFYNILHVLHRITSAICIYCWSLKL